jgi:hypothetical protein
MMCNLAMARKTTNINSKSALAGVHSNADTIIWRIV